MKKNLGFAVLLFFASLPMVAERNSNFEDRIPLVFEIEKDYNFKNGITISGFATVTPPSIQGGGTEFGFGLIKANNFYMRNHIELSAAYKLKPILLGNPMI